MASKQEFIEANSELPAILPIPVQEETDHEQEYEHEDDEEEDEEMEKDRTDMPLDNVPSEVLKTYYFGIGPCHPKWFQFLAKRRVFTFLLCMFAMIEGAVVSGMAPVSYSTIEKRYHFSSTAVGFLPVAFDIAVTLSVIFVSYFGGRGHKPRCIGICMLIMGAGCLVFASPQSLLGSYKVGSINDYLYEVCQDNRTYSVDCTSSDITAYVLFIIGKVLMGIGASPLYTVAQAYLDEIVYPRYITLHMGLYHTMGIVGPVVGYSIGSAFLSIYVDPWLETSLNITDPAWVGAWWISFVIMGVLSLIGAVPFLMFPRYLSDSRLVLLERRKEMAKVYSDTFTTTSDNSLKVTLKMFPVQVKRLLLNPSFLFCSFALGGLYLLSNGLVAFGPQYVENIFFQTPTRAGFISGGVSVVVAICGVLTGGLIIYFFKLKGGKTMFLCFIVALITVPLCFGLLVHCPTASVVGISATDINGSISGIDGPSCASECNCMSHVYEPVCGSDGLTYFSPCRAGCLTHTNGYYNCSCITDGTAVASQGKCASSCHLLIPFIIGVSIVLGMVFLVQIPIYYFTIRAVSDDQRSLALGIQSVIWRSIGSIPGPVVTGAIFDASCLFWENSCNTRGNCWLYDSKKLSTGVTGFTIPVMAIVAVLFLLSCVTFKKETGLDSAHDNNRDKKKWNVKLIGFVTQRKRKEDEDELIT